MIWPKPLRKGPKALIEAYNKLLACAIASQPLRSETCEVHETGKGTQILPNIPAITAGASAPCLLGASLVKTSAGTYKISFAWGTINGRQPAGFSAGSPYQLDATIGQYYYASATADLSTLQWTSTAIYVSGDGALENTTTIAYKLLASVIDDGTGNPTIPGRVCGPITIDFCDLLPESSG